MLTKKNENFIFFMPERLQESEIMEYIQESYRNSVWRGNEMPSTYMTVYGMTSILQYESLARAILKNDYDQDDIFGTFNYHENNFEDWNDDLDSYLNKVVESGYMMGVNESYRKNMRSDIVTLLIKHNFFFREDDDFNGSVLFMKEKDFNLRNLPVRKVW